MYSRGISILSKSDVQTFGLSACCVMSGTKLYSQNYIKIVVHKDIVCQFSFVEKIWLRNLNLCAIFVLYIYLIKKVYYL